GMRLAYHIPAGACRRKQDRADDEWSRTQVFLEHRPRLARRTGHAGGTAAMAAVRAPGLDRVGVPDADVRRWRVRLHEALGIADAAVVPVVRRALCGGGDVVRTARAAGGVGHGRAVPGVVALVSVRPQLLR